MMTGRTVMASVRQPDRSDKPQCSAVQKNSMPNRAYTIEGMPASSCTPGISILTARLLANLDRKMAQNRPTGTPRTRAPRVTQMLPTIIGKMSKTRLAGRRSVPRRKLPRSQVPSTAELTPVVESDCWTSTLT